MLTKLPRVEVIPTDYGQIHQPETTVCTPEPGPPGGSGGGGGGGYWQTVCESVPVFIGWDYGPASFSNPGPFPKAVYVNQQVCRSEWVSG